MIIKNCNQLSSEEKEKLYAWWSKGTQHEPHLLFESPDSLRDSTLYASVAILGTEIIGAAGIFKARTKDQKDIVFQGQHVVELGSNYIEKSFRGNGVGAKLLEARIQVARENNWYPVSVTGNPQMKNIFRKNNGIPMDDKTAFLELRNDLCLCGEKHDKKSCPLEKEAAWFFKE